MEEVRTSDAKEGACALSNEDVDRRAELKAEIGRLFNSKEIWWRQKSRVQWLKEGDKNTKLFHQVANAHKLANQIRDIIIDGVFVGR